MFSPTNSYLSFCSIAMIRREQAHALRHSSIIAQIGRENNDSVDFYVFSFFFKATENILRAFFRQFPTFLYKRIDKQENLCYTCYVCKFIELIERIYPYEMDIP